MGTLTNQLPRNPLKINREELIGRISYLQEVAAETGLKYPDVVKTFDVLEKERANDLYTRNGDTFDEQMAGLGELIERFLSIYNSYCFMILSRNDHGRD